MKMKHLVLEASRVGLRLLLAQSVLCASTAWAVPTVKDRSIVGHWKFDDPSDYGKDYSGYQGGSLSLGSGITGYSSNSGAAWADANGSGYLTFGSGKTVSGTLGSGNSVGASAYQTCAAWFKATCTIGSTTSDPQADIVIGHVDDHEWHFGASRYHLNAAPNSSTTWLITTDPKSWDKNTYCSEASTSYEVYFPVSVDGTKVTLGGSIGAKVAPIFGTKKASFAGDIDEAMVINRMLTKTELTRLYYTGESYIWSSGTPSFDKIDGWSITTDGTTTKEGTSINTLLNWIPGAIKQTTYLIDSQKTMTYGSGAAAYFGQSADNKVALAVGRAEVLKNRLTGADLINGDNLKGAISITADNTALSFWDLRLNAGSITANANNQSVTADMLDVEGEPFNVSVPANCEFTFNAGGKVTGDGVLAKTGDGLLILNNYVKGADRAGFVDAPKVRLAEGSIKTPRLDGYTGGTVLVSTGSTVAFTGDDVLPPEGKKMQIAFDGAKPTAKTAVMTVPDGVTATMIEDVTAYDGGKVGNVTVENGMVFVEPGFPEDMGAVPVLMVE